MKESQKAVIRSLQIKRLVHPSKNGKIRGAFLCIWEKRYKKLSIVRLCP